LPDNPINLAAAEQRTVFKGQRTPAERRFARVVADFCAPLSMPIVIPPVSMFSPGRAGVIAAEAIGADALFFVLPYLRFACADKRDRSKIVGRALSPADLTTATDAFARQKF
jgi:hypothetical protein